MSPAVSSREAQCRYNRRQIVFRVVMWLWFGITVGALALCVPDLIRFINHYPNGDKRQEDCPTKQQ